MDREGPIEYGSSQSSSEDGWNYVYEESDGQTSRRATHTKGKDNEDATAVKRQLLRHCSMSSDESKSQSCESRSSSSTASQMILPDKRRTPGSQKNLTRAERAQIRIMAGSGCSCPAIASYASVHESTVRRVVGRPKDNVAEDYKHVSNAFLEHYRPATSRRTTGKRKLSPIQESEKSSENAYRTSGPSSHSLNGAESRNSPTAKRPRLLRPMQDHERVVIHIPGAYPASTNSSFSAWAGGLSTHDTGTSISIHPSAHVLATDYRPMSAPPPTRISSRIDVEPTAPRAAASQIVGTNTLSRPSTASSFETEHASERMHDTAPVEYTQSVSITEFLANLDLDLSEFYDDLAACDLGCAHRIVFLRDWSEEELRDMLTEAIPRMTVLRRWVLARGMREVNADGSVAPSPVKTMLNGVPDIRTTSVHGFLTSREVDFPLDILHLFLAPKLDTIDTLIVTTGWADEEMHAFFKDAVPTLKAIPRSVLVRGLRVLRQGLDSGEPLSNFLPPASDPPTAVKDREVDDISYGEAFLAALDHDMSARATLLAACGFACARDVARLRRWASEELHAMLRDAVPQLSAVERFVLVQGIRLSDKSGQSDSEE